jgi:hypothetical protein
MVAQETEQPTLLLGEQQQQILVLAAVVTAALQARQIVAVLAGLGL